MCSEPELIEDAFERFSQRWRVSESHVGAMRHTVVLTGQVVDDLHLIAGRESRQYGPDVSAAVADLLASYFDDPVASIQNFSERPTVGRGSQEVASDFGTYWLDLAN